MSSGSRPGPVARLLLVGVTFYQQGISPLTPPSCRFQPTCSAYAAEALRVHGAWRGTWMSLWRLLKCAPWHPGGWDPVPPRSRGPDHGAEAPGRPGSPPADRPAARTPSNHHTR